MLNFNLATPFPSSVAKEKLCILSNKKSNPTQSQLARAYRNHDSFQPPIIRPLLLSSSPLLSVLLRQINLPLRNRQLEPPDRSPSSSNIRDTESQQAEFRVAVVAARG